MMGVGSLLRFAAQVVNSVVQQYTAQMNKVEEQAFNPLQQIMGGVDQVWRGVGAEAFKDELQTIHMPGVNQIHQQGQGFIKNILQAVTIMTKADQEAHQAVQGMDEMFQKIVAF